MIVFQVNNEVAEIADEEPFNLSVARSNSRGNYGRNFAIVEPDRIGFHAAATAISHNAW